MTMTMTMTITMMNEYCLETKTNNIILYSTVVEEVAKPIVLLPDLAFPLAVLGILVYSWYTKPTPPNIPSFVDPLNGTRLNNLDIASLHGVYNNLYPGIPALTSPALNGPRVGIPDLLPLIIQPPVVPVPVVPPEIPIHILLEVASIDARLSWVPIMIKIHVVFIYATYLAGENIIEWLRRR